MQGLCSRPPEANGFRRSERHSEHFRVPKLDIINTEGPLVAHACQTATEDLCIALLTLSIATVGCLD